VAKTTTPRAVVQAVAKHAPGEGVSHRVLDRSFWLDDKIDWPTTDLIEAVDHFELTGDTQPLLKQLGKMGAPGAVLADLLTRHPLPRQRKRGGQQVPVYDLSATDAKLMMALDEMRYLVRSPTAPGHRSQKPMTREAALAAAANKHG
jgi:hypothetical protein